LVVAAASDDNVRDYIMMEDLLQDMAADANGSGYGDEDDAVMDPKGYRAYGGNS